MSVKIRSNDEVRFLRFSHGQIDSYTEEQLQGERFKLLSVDFLTLVEYIQTSVEILMNLKTEEALFNAQKAA